MESILNSIKKPLNISDTDTAFDRDLIMHINTVFMILNQIGIGPINCFSISDASTTWDSFSSDMSTIQAVKTYIYLKVRLIFDPPTSSSVMDAVNRNISELEWRLNVMTESKHN